MVLYHCCVSRERAAKIIAHGFESDQYVHVLDQPPSDKRDAKRPCAIVFLGTPFDFTTGDYAVAKDEDGEQGWLVPGSVLNGFPRAVWPKG